MPLAEWVGCSVPENRIVAVHFGAVCGMLARLEGLYVMVLQLYDIRTFQLSQHNADSVNRHNRTVRGCTRCALTQHCCSATTICLRLLFRLLVPYNFQP